MEIKTYVLMAVSVITAAVVFGACLPVFADTTQANDTFTNEGYLRYTEIDATESYTMSWDITTPEKVTVNGDDYEIWKNGDGTRNISILMVPDHGIVRYNHASSVYVATQVIGLGTLSLGNSYTVTLNNGTYTVTDAENTSITGTFTTAYILDPDGEYILKNSSDRAYLVSGSTIIADSSFIAMGVTTVTSWNNGFQITGTLADYDVEVFNPAVNTFVISDIADDKKEVNGYNDLYTLSKITFNVTDSNDADIDVDATYSYFLVPYEVTAERSVHPEGATLTLMELLPVLIGAGLLIGVVGAVIVRRM